MLEQAVRDNNKDSAEVSADPTVPTHTMPTGNTNAAPQLAHSSTMQEPHTSCMYVSHPLDVDSCLAGVAGSLYASLTDNHNVQTQLYIYIYDYISQRCATCAYCRSLCWSA